MTWLFYRPTHRRGFTLVELAIVVGAISVALGGIWVAGAKVWEDYQVYRLNRQILQTVQNIREFYGPRPANLFPFNAGAGNDISPELDQNNLFPVELRENPNIANGRLRGAFGGVFAVVRDCSNATCNGAGNLDSNSFRIRINSLTQSACIKMLVSAPFNTPEAGLQSFGTFNVAPAVTITPAYVDITDLGQWQHTNTAVRLPLSLSVAQDWCSSAGKNNDIFYRFKIRA